MTQKELKNTKSQSIIQKMKDDKRDIHEYFQGNKNISEIEQKGIKFVKPISY